MTGLQIGQVDNLDTRFYSGRGNRQRNVVRGLARSPGVYQHVGPGGGQFECDCPADAAGRSGDDRRAACERFHAALLRSRGRQKDVCQRILDFVTSSRSSGKNGGSTRLVAVSTLPTAINRQANARAAESKRLGPVTLHAWQDNSSFVGRVLPGERWRR